MALSAWLNSLPTLPIAQSDDVAYNLGFLMGFVIAIGVIVGFVVYKVIYKK